MTFRSHLRMIAATALATLLSVTLIAPAEARPGYPDQINLPVGFQPEGIAIGKSPYAYVGSLANGDIYRANLRTGKGRVISQGRVRHRQAQARPPWTALRGRRAQRRGPDDHLPTGRVSTYALATAPTFVNDVVLTRRAAWFTDSQQPELYRSRATTASGPSQGDRLPLSGDWVQPARIQCERHRRDPDHRALLVVQRDRVIVPGEPEDRCGQAVDLGG